MQFFSIHCKYYYYDAYYKKLFYSAAQSSGPVSILCAEPQQFGATVKKKIEGTLNRWYGCGQIVVKQTVKLLIVVIVLNFKNFNKRRLHCLINKRGRPCSCIHCCSGKAMSITYSEPVFLVLVTQRAKRMRRIILPSVVCPALPYFTTPSHKRHDLRKNYWT